MPFGLGTTTPATPAKRGARASLDLEQSLPKIRRRAAAPPVLAKPAPSGAFEDHLRHHRLGKTCDKCNYAINRDLWEAVASLPEGGAWLQPQPVHAESWWVGCSSCEAAASGPSRPLRLQGKSLRLSNIRQHASTHAHARATISAAASDESVAVAPPRTSLSKR